jgi:DNA (cytosine-5)-methyltransferase 1
VSDVPGPQERQGSTGKDSRVTEPLCEFRVLDLFCGAGGMGMGYRLAGAEVVGVDKVDQPRYPFAFIRGDWREVLDAPWFDVQAFDLIHASPPCQHYSDLAKRNGNASAHPDLIGSVREALATTGLPYAIENVEGAPLRDPVLVCGTERQLEVDGYRLRRHRLFETNWPLELRGCGCAGDSRPIIDVSGGGPTHAPRRDGKGGRTYKGTAVQASAAMGIGWMTKAELNEAIPPAYAKLIAFQFLRWKAGVRVAA